MFPISYYLAKKLEPPDSLTIPTAVTFVSSIDGEAERIVQFLQGVEALHGVPRAQLEWLLRESEVWKLGPGLLAKPGEPNDLMEYMVVLLEGSFEAYVIQNGQKKTQMATGPGSMTGMLPFSRMKYTPVYIEIKGNVKLLALHRSKFHALIAANYELTEAMVHSMIDRVRLFTSAHFQNEKLMSLGKLSAGLAHELNNPAAAIVRSAEDLKQIIGDVSEKLKSLGLVHLTAPEIESVTHILTEAQSQSTKRIPLLERKRQEDSIADWLQDRNILTDCSETFVSFGFTTADLDQIENCISKSALFPFTKWLAGELQAQNAVDEIATSSRRISELVQSVKSYTRMDQVQDMQEMCINDGIHNTITMLQYKMRKNSIELHEDLAEGLPLILGFPGELNQVWTNIIDNALDAMKDGGELTVRTINEPPNVIFNVIDTGPGISPENLERIFDPFFTTKDVGEGTGVGLDVVQKVVTLHHGKIDVTSKPGRTEFRIAFPRIASSSPGH